MEEINYSLDDLRQRLQSYVIERAGRTIWSVDWSTIEPAITEYMNDYNQAVSEAASASGETGIMQSVTDSYPDNISTCIRLVIEQPCSSDAAFRILCVREHIRHITVAGRTYSRQEIACMEAGRELGGRETGLAVDREPVPLDVPMPRGPFGDPVMVAPAPQQTATEVGVYEQLQQAGNTIPRTTNQLDIDGLVQDARNWARERDRQREMTALPGARITPTPVDTLMQTIGVTREVAEELIHTYTNRGQTVRFSNMTDADNFSANAGMVSAEDTYF